MNTFEEIQAMSEQEKSEYVFKNIMGLKKVSCPGHKYDNGAWKVEPGQDTLWLYGEDSVIEELQKKHGCPMRFPYSKETVQPAPSEMNIFMDWNAWRHIEEKIFQDEALFRSMCTKIVLEKGVKDSGYGAAEMYVIADKNLKIDCLIFAHQRLQK